MFTKLTGKRKAGGFLLEDLVGNFLTKSCLSDWCSNTTFYFELTLQGGGRIQMLTYQTEAENIISKEKGNHGERGRPSGAQFLCYFNKLNYKRIVVTARTGE